MEKRAMSRAWAKTKYLVVTYQLLIGFLKITWQKNTADEIRQCFTYTNVNFHYPNDVEELNLLVETFQKETYDKDKKADSKIDGDGYNIFE